MQCDMLNIIKEKKASELFNLLESQGKIEVLSECAQFLDKRAYITIDTNGNLKRKKGSIALPVIAFLNDNNLFVEELLYSCDIKERQNLDKIERYSSLDIEKVKTNYIKTLFNGNLEFAKRYGKELFLRDRKEFFKISSNFALIGANNIKPLMVLALNKLMSEYNENIFYIFIQYMVKFRDNTEIYEKVSEYEGEAKEIKEILKSNKNLLESLEGLEILSSLKLVENIDISNKKKVLGKLKYMIENIKDYTSLREVEKKLLESFL